MNLMQSPGFGNRARPARRPVIASASEAIQGNKQELDCFRLRYAVPGDDARNRDDTPKSKGGLEARHLIET
jgi:hypothetical protein